MVIRVLAVATFLPEIPRPWVGLRFSLPLPGLRKASPVDGLQAHGRITGHLPGWEGGTVQDQGCVALTAGHRTWSQPNTDHPALHSAQLWPEGAQLLSGLPVPSDACMVSPASQTSCNTQSAAALGFLIKRDLLGVLMRQNQECSGFAVRQTWIPDPAASLAGCGTLSAVLSSILLYSHANREA